MKIVKFKGGLGNQLFQYAFLRLLEEKCEGTEIKADLQYYSYISNDTIRKPRILDLNVRLVETTVAETNKICFFRHSGNFSKPGYKIRIILDALLNKKYFFEINRKYCVQDKLLKYEYYDGYWQSWRYVSPICELLKKEIIPKNFPNINARIIRKDIENHNAVFVGIRRGDYFINAREKKLYDVIDNHYYSKAINYIISKVDNPIFYIFSNDIEWVKYNLELPGKIIYREIDSQTNDLDELFLMASCKHAIISNSTFYWWGAWLINNFQKIVIAPQKWFGTSEFIDIIPPEWIQM